MKVYYLIQLNYQLNGHLENFNYFIFKKDEIFHVT